MKRQLELSVIIPTLNEENYLPNLLKSLKQNLKNINSEVIIVDGYSKDKTIQVARKSGIKNLRIFRARKGGPSYQRNYGARKARAYWLLFLDADVVLPKNFLKCAFREIKQRNIDIAACYCEPEKRGVFELIVFGLANLWMHLFEKSKPFAQDCFFIKTELHKKINGFDETISFGEDSEYVERASKLGYKFRILMNDKKYIISSRAFKRYGRFSQSFACMCLNFYRLSGHERRKEKHFTELYSKFEKISPTTLEKKIEKRIEKKYLKKGKKKLYSEYGK
jgi:glycosyltransferase involved in cell wall biosynthesis